MFSVIRSTIIFLVQIKYPKYSLLCFPSPSTVSRNIHVFQLPTLQSPTARQSKPWGRPQVLISIQYRTCQSRTFSYKSSHFFLNFSLQRYKKSRDPFSDSNKRSSVRSTFLSTVQCYHDTIQKGFFVDRQLYSQGIGHFRTPVPASRVQNCFEKFFFCSIEGPKSYFRSVYEFFIPNYPTTGWDRRCFTDRNPG